MEIPKLNVKAKEHEFRLETHKLAVSQIQEGLMPEVPIKKMDSNFIPKEDNFLLTLKPLDLFDSLDKEYAKVKDFDFSKIDVKDIKKHIRNV